MRIIVDTNRIIAALLKAGTTRDLLFNDFFTFLTPDYTLFEIEKHRAVIQQKARLAKDDLDVLLALVFERITVLPASSYAKYIPECRAAVEDADDAPYLAACLSSKALGVWSHDPHILKQKKAPVFTNIGLLNLSR